MINHRRRFASAAIALAFVLAASVGAAASSTNPSAAKASPTPVIIGLPNNQPSYAPAYLMAYSNFCAPYGLNVSNDILTPTTQIAALAAGDVQFITTPTSTASAMLSGALQAKFIADMGTAATALFGGPSITKVSQLEGKTVSATTPASVGAEATPMLLTGVDKLPAGSYGIIYSGSASASVAAIANGQASATISVLPLQPAYAAVGLHPLQTLASAGLGWTNEDFIAVTDSYLAHNARVVNKFLKCFAAAVTAGRKDKKLASEAIAAFIPGSNGVPALTYAQEARPIEFGVDALMPISSLSLTKALALLLNESRTTAKANVTGLFDNSYIKALHIDIKEAPIKISKLSAG